MACGSTRGSWSLVARDGGSCLAKLAAGPAPGSVLAEPLPELMHSLAYILGSQAPASKSAREKLKRRMQVVVCVLWIATPKANKDCHLKAGLEKPIQLKLVEQQQRRKGHLDLDPPEGCQDVVQLGAPCPKS